MFVKTLLPYFLYACLVVLDSPIGDGALLSLVELWLNFGYPLILSRILLFGSLLGNETGNPT